MHRCSGCVVFSDASGFTKLTETLAQRADGAEVLSKSLNKFFTPLIDIIEAYRGDVIKFSGDALSILFEATDDYTLHPCPCGSPESSKKTPLQLASLRASACCLAIHKRLHNFDTGEGGVRLTLHIGVGAGNITLLQVGGEHGRYEYVIAGTPMEQIAIAEPLAASGETVLSPQIWSEVAYTVIEGAPLTEGPPGFHRLAALDTYQHTYPTVKQAALECTRIEDRRREPIETQYEKILLAHSERFIPRAVLKHLRSGNSSSINEMRSVTIIFAQIGGVDVSTDDGAKVAQELMTNMQRACYNHEGNLNKFLVDDKGLLFLYVFGLPPVVHIDDPSRAIGSCFEMVRALKGMGLVGRFGVTTGRVFCGIVGSAKRREYTVMGDTVNLSARLMAKAGENSVLMDETTFQRSQRDISCKKLAPIMVKGKSLPIQIYAPDPPVVHGTVISQLASFIGQRGWGLESTPLSVNNIEGDSMTVQLPWRAASQALGGQSPLLQLTRWKDLQKVDQLLTPPADGEKGLLEVGGGLLLTGDSGIGKQELSEHLIHSGMRANLIPLFGYQRSRGPEQWRAVAELIQNCLLVLSKIHLGSTPDQLEDVAESLLERFICPDGSLRRVLVFLGFGGFDMPDELPGCLPPSELELEVGAVRIASTLVSAVANYRGVLVLLRIRRGTDIFDGLRGGKASVFWRLSVELARLAHQRRSSICSAAADSKNAIVVVTVARQKPEVGLDLPTDIFDTDTLSNVSIHSGTAWQEPQNPMKVKELQLLPLTEDASVELMCLCLGLSTADGGTLVKRRLREFVIAVTINIPAYIQECLQQMMAGNYVSLTDGECHIAAPDLNTVNIAEWVQTSMVGGTISQLESLGSAKQHIMKMATVFDGPFSALDLAATNRVLFGRLPKTLTFHDMATLLSSCTDLVKQGFLTRVTLPAHASAADRAPTHLPRWTISNTLVRRVAGSMVLNSYRLLIKRAVLIERALNVELPKRMGLNKGGSKKKWLKDKNDGKSEGREVSATFQHAGSHSKSPFKPIEQKDLESKSEEAKDLLSSACVLGNLTVVTEVLNAHKDLDIVCCSSTGGYTPLHFACSSGEIDIVHLLCEHGAVVDVMSNEQETPLLIAAQRGHLEVVQYLCETQRALSSAGARDQYYWERMLPEIMTEEEIPQPLVPQHQSPVTNQEALNIKRKDVHEWLVKKMSGNNAEISTTTLAGGSRRPSIDSQPSSRSIHSSNDGKPLSAPECPSETPSSKRTSLVEEQLSMQEPVPKFKSSLVGSDRGSVLGMTPLRSIKHSAWLERWKGLAWRARMRIFLRSRLVLAIMMVALMLALYMPDVWVAVGAPGDAGLDITLTLVMLMFLCELVLMSLVDSTYWFSFFFFMDCIGTFSMILDISVLLGTSAEKPQENTDTQSDLTLFRAARTAKIGARAGRLSRLVKVLRFLPGIGISRGGQDEAAQLKQISNQLSNVLSKRVACLTILLVIVLPLFSLGLYPEADFSMRVWIDALTRRVVANNLAPSSCAGVDPELQASVDQFAAFYQSRAYGPYRICIRSMCCNLQYSKFVPPERKSFQLEVSSDIMKAHFDYSMPMRAEAEMGIALTSLVIVLMCSVCLLLNYSASELAVRPLERMLGSIKKSAKAIFSSVNSLGEDAKTQDDDEFDETLESEIALLEQVVKKIAALAELSSKKNAFDAQAISGMKSEELGVLAMTNTTLQRGNVEDPAVVSVPIDGANEVTVTMQWQLEEIGEKYELFNSWHFCPLDFDEPKQKAISAWMVMNNPGSCAFTEHNVDMKKIRGFIEVICQGYQPNPYHNFMHAVDVTHAIFQYMNLMRASLCFSMLEQFSLLIASLAHDVGHPGNNNGFLTEVQDEIAIRYNDRSPLENMHCCKLFETMCQEGADVFQGVSQEQYREVRKLIIEVILHTDIVQHPGMVKELELLYEMNARIFETKDGDGLSEQEVELLSTNEHKKLLGKLLMHTSDISNPIMPFEIAQVWATHVLNEYFAQGEQEKKLGIPVQILNDRDSVNRPHSQIGFIEFIVAPLVTAQVKIIPAWRDTSINLEENLKQWEAMWQQEVNPSEQERDKVRERVNKVVTLLGTCQKSWQSTQSKPQGRRISRAMQ